MSGDRDFDALLDSALREYSSPEGPLGLESRVLRAVREREKPVRWWLLMLPAVSVAALAFVSLLPAPTIDVPLPNGRGSVTPPPPIAYRFTPPYRAATVRERVRQSPSPQQQALLDFVTKYPEDAADILPALPSEIAIKPLELEALTIRELD